MIRSTATRLSKNESKRCLECKISKRCPERCQVVVLGDRFETFCMAAAAQVCQVPIAHIHGGETTEGAIDEAFRHSITKMSHLHFASCEAYRQRIIQLGEDPDRVFNVGALGVENIRRMSLMERSELAESIGFSLRSCIKPV